jgi:hypothetical protein
MNEANQRIKQLADEARKKPMGDSWCYTSPEEFEQKFAALIIVECAQACMNEGASYEEKAAGAYQSNLYVTAIKQHFGVEE